MSDTTADPGSEQVAIVDGSDVLIRPASRREMRDTGLLHRVTYILVFSSSGQLLVQTRTKTKDWYPGIYDFAAGGVLQYDESYDLSASRELAEELGVEAELQYQFKMYFEDRAGDPVTKSWGQVYSCVCDGPFSLQPEEVAAAEFMDVDKALAISPDRVTPDSRLALHNYLL